MGDRWSYPHQASAATYVWMPLRVESTKISIPEYWQAWDINKLKPVNPLNGSLQIEKKQIYADSYWHITKDKMESDVKGSVLSASFRGTRAAIIGESTPLGGYARVNVINEKRDTVYSSLIDFYSKYPEMAIRVITPVMEKGEYTISVEVTGIRPIWSDKTKRVYGSKGTFVSINQILYFEEE